MHALSSNPAIKETSMKRKILWAFLIIWLILTAYLLFLSNKWASAATPSYAASSAVTTDNFAELLRETLQKNPDLLLSVLRENSEAVLDIAQEGSNQRRHKSLIAQWKAELNQPKEVESMLNLSGNSLEEAYKVLEIDPSATNEEVRTAYRRLALKHHPDRVATLGEDVKKAAEEKFQQINNAKERIYKARGIK